MQKLTTMLFCILSCSVLMAQEPETEIFPEDKIFIKGTLYYFDGRREIYSGLQFRKTEVLFTDEAGNLQLKPLEEIEFISSRENRVGDGALLGGVIALTAGYLAGSLIYSEDGTLWWRKSNDDNGHSIKKEAIPLLAGSTFGGIVIGALLGLTSKKEKTIYHRHGSIDVFPGVSYQPFKQQVVSLNVRIQLN